jgi:hypothetical protein
MFARPHLNRKKVGHGGMHLSSQLPQKVLRRRIMVQANLGKKQDPISKITRANRAGGMAKAVQYCGEWIMRSL